MTDNSDVKIGSEGNHVGGLYKSISEAQHMKLYLENLKLMASVGASKDELTIKVGETEKKVLISSLIPKESEFERVRKIVISNLNGMTDDALRGYQAKYDADSIFELSGKIANFMLDQRRKNAAYADIEKWIATS
jgi:hypothetical protein